MFNFLCFLHVSKPRVPLQEDGCINRYGTVCFSCINLSSLVGRMNVFDIHNRLPEDEPSGSKHVEDTKI